MMASHIVTACWLFFLFRGVLITTVNPHVKVNSTIDGRSHVFTVSAQWPV